MIYTFLLYMQNPIGFKHNWNWFLLLVALIKTFLLWIISGYNDLLSTKVNICRSNLNIWQYLNRIWNLCQSVSKDVVCYLKEFVCIRSSFPLCDKRYPFSFHIQRDFRSDWFTLKTSYKRFHLHILTTSVVFNWVLLKNRLLKCSITIVIVVFCHFLLITDTTCRVNSCSFNTFNSSLKGFHYNKVGCFGLIRIASKGLMASVTN